MDSAQSKHNFINQLEINKIKKLSNLLPTSFIVDKFK